MKYFDIIAFLFVLCIIGISIIITVMVVHNMNEQKLTCQKIGYSNIKYDTPFSYCVKVINGNVYKYYLSPGDYAE